MDAEDIRKYDVKEYWIADPDKEQLLVYRFGDMDLPKSYTFEDIVPVGISDGECIIDLRRVHAKLQRLKNWFR